MPADNMPSGKTHGAHKVPHREEDPGLGWDEFFQSLVTERTPDRRRALPQGIQE
ncbi:hypothetical protein IQ03_03378 [Gemmobacter caeni]|uniref:Uncharacterized protein n=1 Tax=Gemmobacter caeni TaxID=589035 RepID=A0A2T6ATW7_9RHOB|nr:MULTISPECIES: hypothetical protein [Gemmobacter]PTX47261.1 hypothetical protein C8N34_11317 [Gemmobacter caeni]TWI96500.1 hypothetical protein IQ03_03378 [Gemmobacter caeni]